MTSSVVGLLVAGGEAVASRVAVSHVCCSYHAKLRSLLCWVFVGGALALQFLVLASGGADVEQPEKKSRTLL